MSAAARIELRLRELSQLFNSMDPSPFHEKDLDRNAEEFIVGWARELPRDRPLEIVIHLADGGVDSTTAAARSRDVQDSLQHYFAYKADHERRQFSELMRYGQVTLFFGLVFLATCLLLSSLLSTEHTGNIRRVLQESLIIIGWVSLWRPLEIFLYDWWPIRRHLKLYRRLSRAEVGIVSSTASAA